MDGPNQFCELHRLDDASVLADVARALEVHGIDADVWPEHGNGLMPWAGRTWRLMVRCRDVVYARWIAAAEGMDTWPDEEAGNEG
jgi:hypothetical protein